MKYLECPHADCRRPDRRAAVSSHAQSGVAPEVGNRCRRAGTDQVRQVPQALAKVREADAVGGQERGREHEDRAHAPGRSVGPGDADTAAKSFETVSGGVGGADKLRMIESIAGTYYRSRNMRGYAVVPALLQGRRTSGAIARC